MRITKRRVLYVFAALLGVVFVLACLAGFEACGGSSEEEHVHTWDAGVVTKEADCGNAGVTTYTCTECGETKTETIPATGNHTWDEGKVTKEATATENGEMTYTCKVCGATKTETIPATGGDENPSGGDGNTPGTGDEGGEMPGGDENPGEGGETTGGDDDNPGDTCDHVLTGTYDSTTQQWAYTCSVCSESVTLDETTPVASLTLEATDEDSLRAAGLWGEVSTLDVTPVIDVATTDVNQGKITVSSDHIRVDGGDTPMDKDVLLNADIDMSTYATIVRGTTVFDLNGHTMSSSSESEYGTLQVGSGTTYGNLTVIDCAGTGKITGANGVTVRGEDNSNGDISTFTLVSGTVEGSNIAVSTNGSNNWGCEVVNIQGGTISGTGNAGVGVYIPNGTLNVTGGTISGTTGIEIKSGTATISGATISTTVTEGNPSVNTNTKGTDSYGYAIAIISTNTSYHDLTSVTIGSGCTIGGTIYSDVTSSEGTTVTIDESLNLVKVAYDATGNVIEDETAEGTAVDHYVYGTHCEIIGHALVGTYDSATQQWTYTCSVCDEEIELTADTLVASLTLIADDEASLRAAGLWGGIELEVTPVIDVATTTENGGTITVSTDNIRIGGGDTPMDKDIVLNADIDMTSWTIIVRCECVMDLNGHTISRTNDTSLTTGVVQVGSSTTYGDLTVKDSVGAGKISGSYGVVINAATNTDNKVSTFTLVSGTVKGSEIAISTNGSSNFGAEFINIEGGTVSGGAAGIYLPSGSLTVSGGEISGATGIEIKAGSATITGGTISTTVENGTTSVNKNSEGTDTCGYAIAIINGNAIGSYKTLTSVSISDGVTLTGTVYVDASVDGVVTVCDGLDLAKDACDESGDVIADETAEGVEVDHYIYRAKTVCEKNGHVPVDYGDGKVYYMYNSEDGKWYAQCANCGKWVIELDLGSYNS